jgi:hypothetical protein
MTGTKGTAAPESTLYDLAREEMQGLVDRYLKLAEASDGLVTVTAGAIETVHERRVLLAGFGAQDDPNAVSAEFVAEEVRRRSAVPFDIERAITTGVYMVLRERSEEWLATLSSETDDFAKLDASYIQAHPAWLPLFMRIAGVFSKAELKRLIGSATDQRISAPAAAKLASLVDDRVTGGSALTAGEVLRGLEGTLEGIVRDLVGRLLLESLVENALKSRGLEFQREAEYKSLPGVVYDIRADFVLPTAEEPLAFIEVRKSSSRHASLYAKDKMFSAINWKGKHPDLLGVLVTDGDWTRATLEILPRVFDYVVPITNLPVMADTLKAYIVDQDRSKLKWLIDFAVRANART